MHAYVDVVTAPTNPPCLVELGWESDLAVVALDALADVEAFPARHLAIATGDHRRLAQMAHAHEVSWYLGAAPMASLPFDPATIETPYAIRIHRGSGLSDCEQRELLGLVWLGHPNPRVDLDAPRTQLHAYVTDGGVLWGRGTGAPRFMPTNTQKRPFVTSSQLPPRRARALLDLAGVREGDAVLDPFCGTGAVAIEAAKLGARAHASDIDGRAVKGTFANASYEGVHVDVRLHDAAASEHWRTTFDAVATDLPYGRSASLHGETNAELAQRWVAHIGSVVRPGGSVVAMAPERSLPAGSDVLAERHRFRELVHSGLTREVVVYERVG